MTDTDPMWEAVDTATGWLDAANGRTDHELTCRILKLTEEAGEVAVAWIGALGQNPRKGVTHTRADVVAELADVAVTALVAISSLGHDPRAAMAECAAKISGRSQPSRESSA
ncbi:MazG-like family protein [Stackebrandtia albiflava]|nr:MazG-like family protein [Stackebrandtia albiflava]